MPSHIVPNVLAPALKVIFCGTAPSDTSARQRVYYGHRHNRFWKTLNEVGFTPHELQPSDYQHMLQFQLGLTDLCKEASGNDDELPKGALNVVALREVVTQFQPNVLAFTSKTAGKAFCRQEVNYGWQEQTIGITKIFVLPSTSPRARRYWNIQPWRELAVIVQTL